jgi:preprotein translocase subunit SecA
MEREKRAVPRLTDRVAYSLSTARGVTIEYDLREYEKVVREIRGLDFSGRSDAELSELAFEVRGRVRDGATLESELVHGFALVAEGCSRLLGLRPYDEQLVAGIAMHQRKLAQMQTGEGKTLAAVFPACLRALEGRGVHVMTANDYLARRDADWMRPVYELLGLRVSSIGEDTTAAERRTAYRADVTYLSAREAGFDYLRDALAFDAGDLVQRELHAALVDEADFILIDEARIPLVIAGAGGREQIDIGRVDSFVLGLRPGLDYEADRQGRQVSILLAGHGRIEAAFGIEGIHVQQGADVFARVSAALHAHALLRRDVDYVVKNGRAELVDELTGRIADRRQWPYGIQAALEAKEGLAIGVEGRVYGSITVQHFMGLYEKLAAMTATAVPSAEELAGFYGLATVVVPPVKPVRRVDLPDAVFRTRRAKLAGVVREVSAAHAVGRPVLVGTSSVRESQELADLLAEAGVLCEVLNAKNNEREAELIAGAGRLGAVTISTNMAGRGTDIRPDERSLALGGLYVIGTNRHESRRIDDQLRGRAGRQGEPGCSRFFISLEDPLFERHGVREFLPRERPARIEEPIRDPRFLREIDRAQAIIDGQHHVIRRTLRKYSQLVELDRRRIRMLRDDALRNGRLPRELEEACDVAGTAGIRSLLTQAFLSSLDRFWADHLMLVDDVREGIDLERYAGRDPGLQYIQRVGDAFEEGLRGVVQSLVAVCERSGGDPRALSTAEWGISRPSSTWTYQIDDAAPVRFNLSAIASSSIGAAALAAVPLLVLNLAVWLFGALSRLVRGTRGGPQRPVSGDPGPRR